MAKTPSQKLFKLVKSLSGSEKRHFKLYVRAREGNGGAKYDQMFDTILTQETFDEEALIAAVYADEPIESRKFSELKGYLYDLVLKSLVVYDEKSSIEYTLKNMLAGVRSLYRRSLFDDCTDTLKKAKKLATEHEHFNTLIEILNWERKIAYAQTDIAFLDKNLDRISEEENHCLAQLKNLSEYKGVFFKKLVSVRKNVYKRSGAQKNAPEDPLMETAEKATSLGAKLLYYRTESIHYFSTAQYQEFYESSLKLLSLMEANPRILQEDVSEYISALNNHIISCGTLGKYAEVRSTLEKLKGVPPLTKDDAVKISRQYYMNKFRLCITSGEFAEGASELEAHLKEIENADKKLYNKNSFYLQYFCIYFGSKNYDRALDVLNEWINELTGSVERRDLQSLARILNLIIHYELGNEVLLESLLRSAHRFLGKEDHLSKLEEKFMDFMKVAVKPQSKKELKQALERLKSEFEGLSKTPGYGIFGLFDISAWIESRISGKSFAEIVRQKFRETQSA